MTESRSSSLIHKANTELISNGELGGLGAFFTQDYAVHLTGRVLTGGHDLIRSSMTRLRRAFPDIRVEVEVLLEGEGRVAWQRTMRGTHDGAYSGFPASGREIVWRDMVTSQFREGLISEEWIVTDLAERLLRSRKR